MAGQWPFIEFCFISSHVYLLDGWIYTRGREERSREQERGNCFAFLANTLLEVIVLRV